MTRPHGFYLDITVVGEKEVREAAAKTVAGGEVAVIHHHRHGERCRPTCETLQPPPPPVRLPPRSSDVGHSIVLSDGQGWGDADVPTLTVPG